MSEQYPSKTEGEPSDAEPQPKPDYVEPQPKPDYVEPQPKPDYVEPQPAPVEHEDESEDEKSHVTETIESRIEDVKQKARELLDDKR